MSVFEKINWFSIGLLGKFLVWFWGVSTRKTVFGEKEYVKLRKAGRPVIIVLWHSRILFAPYFFRNRNVTALVSPSTDGEIIAQILSRWGYQLLRGSSSHSVVEEWRKMKRLMEVGGELIIVGDGPKGPAKILKPGAVKLAQATGAWVVPFTYSAKKRKHLKSWDRFLLFYPFSKLIAVYGKPLKVKSDLNADEVEEKRFQIQQKLIELEKTADESF
ncbi:MAG: DUF374 domain-containing protein [Candidatus Aminicenantes bacterium]|nr:DUF374 domain-containing protein [Candidatus Aminicenantes bacterium]